MTLAQWFVIVVVAVPLAFVAANRLRVEAGALVIAVCLGIAQWLGLGVLGPPNTPGDAVKAISGFGQPVVITLLSLFILTQCLEEAGITRAIANRLLAAGGKSETRLIGLFATVTALLSLFMNNLAAGALMLPSALSVARRSGVRPSKLLIPVAYGSLLGGAATYFTTANIIASNLLLTANPPQAPLGVLDFTPTGGLVALAGIALLILAGKRLLPDREPSPEQQVARHTGSELEDVYQLGERLWEARILSGAALAGKTLAESGIGRELGLSVAAVWRGRHAHFAPTSDFQFMEGDVLQLIGGEERVNQLIAQGVSVSREPLSGHMSLRGIRVVEVLLAPHSRVEGQSLRELRFRGRYGFTGVALFRGGRSYRTGVADLKLAPGDSLLLAGAPDRLPALRNSPDFILLEPDAGDQPVRRKQAVLAIALIGGAIIAAVLGVPTYLAMLTGATAAIVVGLVSLDAVYRKMEWRVIILIAGMFTISIAMVQTGLVNLIGDGMRDALDPTSRASG